jgi:hypothetical protein
LAEAWFDYTTIGNHKSTPALPILLKSRYRHQTRQTPVAASAWMLNDILDFPQRRSVK